MKVTHGISVSLYFEDPEGNRVEVYCDSPFYCVQPQREPVDLGQSDEEIWNLVEAHARQQQHFMMKADWTSKMRKKMEADQKAWKGSQSSRSRL